MDISRTMIELAKSRHPDLKFYRANLMERSELPKKKYEGFWSAATLQHIPLEQWSTMLDHIQLLTIPGGIGYFSIPADRSNPMQADSRHFTVLSPTEVAAILERRGWQTLRSGRLPSSRNTKVWNWFIVRLEKVR
jgi:trans-aconitate methyltransferase